MKPAVVDVSSVDNQDAVRFKLELPSDNDIVGFTVSDDNAARQMSPMIKQSVYLHRSFPLSELGPSKKREAKVNGRRIKGIELVPESEFRLGAFFLASAVQ